MRPGRTQAGVQATGWVRRDGTEVNFPRLVSPQPQADVTSLGRELPPVYTQARVGSPGFCPSPHLCQETFPPSPFAERAAAGQLLGAGGGFLPPAEVELLVGSLPAMP